MSALVCLASGIDAFYLSGRGSVPQALIALLASEQKKSGADRDTGGSSPVWFGEHEVEVGWGSWEGYRYRLELHGRAIIGLVPLADAFPVARVVPRAQFLHEVGPHGVVEWVNEFADALGIEVQWTVSRVDLFADFQGLRLDAQSRTNFVGRSRRCRVYEVDGKLETLYFGSGKPLLVRIYDKTKESAAKGSDWLPDAWGPNHRRGEQVWRIEFQVSRDYLRDLGLFSPEDVLDSSDALWAKLTSESLSLRTPTKDSNHSRWPLAPEWRAVQAVQIDGSHAGHALVREGQKRGDLRKLMPLLVGQMSSVAALTGARDEHELMARLPALVSNYTTERGLIFSERVASKRRAYETDERVSGD